MMANDPQEPKNQTNFHDKVVGSAVGGGTVWAENIAGGDINIKKIYPPAKEKEKPTFPIHYITHPQNPNFTGREQILQQMAETLNAGQTTVVTQTIAGLGGVGKTQVALAYSYAHLDDYDLLYWLNADSEPALGEELMTLARRLKLIAPAATDQQAAIQLTLNWLSQTEQRWLLVYDNADQIEPQQLTAYLPRTGNGHILITSRNPNYGGLGQVLELGLFTPDEAVEFLFQRKGAKAERKSKEWNEAAALAEELGRFPLALEHAAAYAESKGSNYAAYHRLFTTRRAELWSRVETPERYHATITTTWELAFDEVKKTLGALDLLNLCCFLDPESIPLDLIKQIASLEVQGDSTLQEVVSDELALDDAIGALRRYSLVQRADNRMTMHRLVQIVVRDQMGEEKRLMWLQIAVDLANILFPDNLHSLYSWAKGNILFPHILTIASLAHETQLGNASSSVLFNRTGFYLHVRGEYNLAKFYYECDLSICKKFLGFNHPHTAAILNNLGTLVQAMGDLNLAHEYLKQAHVIKENVLGLYHPEVARSFNNLSMLVKEIGDQEKAKSYLERALQIIEKAPRSDETQLLKATILNNLGLQVQDMGNLNAAHSLYKRALNIRKKVLDLEHPDTATCYNNLGTLMQKMGNLPTARTYHKRALTIRKKALESDHPDIAQSLRNLAWLYVQENNVIQAIEYMRNAVAIYEAKLGLEHPFTKSARHNLATFETKLH